jgi:hypothetical protein
MATYLLKCNAMHFLISSMVEGCVEPKHGIAGNEMEDELLVDAKLERRDTELKHSANCTFHQ